MRHSQGTTTSIGTHGPKVEGERNRHLEATLHVNLLEAVKQDRTTAQSPGPIMLLCSRAGSFVVNQLRRDVILLFEKLSTTLSDVFAGSLVCSCDRMIPYG